jgi:hypothetical protein
MIRDADYSPLLTLIAESVPPSIKLTHGPEPMRAWVGRAFEATRAKGAGEKRLARQRLKVEAAVTLEVEYEYEGNTYTAWLAGGKLRLHAPINPVTDALKARVKDAVREWEEGDPKEATALLLGVTEMAEADDWCRRAYDQMRGQVPAGLGSRAKWERQKPVVIVVAAVVGLFLLLVVAVMADALTRPRHADTPEPPRTLGQSEDGVEEEYARRLVGRWEVMDGARKGATITFREDGKAILTRSGPKAPLPAVSATFRVQTLIRRVDLVLEPADAEVLGDQPQYTMVFLSADELVLSETSHQGKGPFAGLAGRLKRIGTR